VCSQLLQAAGDGAAEGRVGGERERESHRTAALSAGDGSGTGRLEPTLDTPAGRGHGVKKER